MKATFELGYGQLEPAQARAFRLLGLADGPDLSLASAAAVLDLPAEDAEDLLESLVDTSLLESAAPGRYRFHDLVRLYARACAERDEHPPSERDAALSRLLDFYLATAAAVYAIERPGDRLVDHLAATDRPGLAFTDRASARDWLYTEANCLLAFARQCAGRPGSLRRAVDLLWAAHDLSESGANSREYEATAKALLQAAHRGGVAREEARALMTLAHAHLDGGRFDMADREAEQVIRRAREAADLLPVCWAHNARGVIALYQNRNAEGEEHLSRAIGHFRTLGDRPGEASALCNLSRIRLATGRTQSAVALAQEGMEIYDTMGNSMRGANGRYALGMALTQSGRLDAAAERLLEALEVFRDSRQRLWEGMTLFRLAEVDIAGRRFAQAAANAEMALTVLRGIGGEWRRANVLTVLGRALSGIGHTGRAQVCWQEAVRVYEELDAPEAAEVRALLTPLRAA
ncbi:hypothetical protein GCM10020295_47630 [Streptomyces cinereospinus]